MQISKTDYMLFLKHPAWIWLRKHDKNKLPPVSEALQTIFDEGHLFEKYAEQLFPNAIKLGLNDYSYSDLPKRTSEALSNGAKTIFQGRFEHKKLTCIIDVLERADNGEFNLYEIKSSASVKPEHIDDLAFQFLVLDGAGIKIKKMAVICVNNEYIRNGEVDAQGISMVTDATEEVREKLDETKANLEIVYQILNSKTPPNLSPRYSKREFKDWMEVYKFINGEPDKYSIYNLARLNAKLVGELEDLNIKLIKDIPKNINLHIKQEGQVEANRQDKQIIDSKRIKDFLSKIKFPLYFLDYETMSSVIPYFDGTKPYQQLPFQYSLYILDKPDGELIHKEYLHRENTLPCLPLLKQIKEDIGNKGTIFVWHESFEKGRNTEMGELFPEYKEFMQFVNDRIIDLKIPFSSDWFIDKDFFGSASIKQVLPALIKDLSYKELEIQGGTAAQRIWMETILEGGNIDTKVKIMSALIEYCKLDTLAMVRLYQLLNKLAPDQ